MSCPETESFISNWNRIHQQTARVIAAAPDGKLDWRPKEGMYTLRELVTHIPTAEVMLARTAMAGTTQKPDMDLTGHSVAQIVEAFDQHPAAAAEEVSRLTAEQWTEEVEFYGRRMPRRALLRAMTEHEINHRGQLCTYLHLVDVQPPNLYS